MLTTTENLLLCPETAIQKKTDSVVPIVRERIFGIPIDRDVLFTDAHNIYRGRIEKRQRQLIIKLSFLRSFLQPGERVILVTTAYSPLRLVEQLLTAGLFLDLERAFIVFTNYRMLHVPVGRHARYRQAIAQIGYRDIRTIQLRRGALEIVYKQGILEKFKAIAFAERKKINQLLPALPLTKKVLSSATRLHLCPQCTRTLIKPVTRCARCGQVFKTKRRTLLATLFTPGGGYLYLRHRRPFVYFSLAEAAAGFVVAWFFGHQGPAAFENATLWLALAAMVILRGLAWFHSAHLLGEFVPGHTREKSLQVFEPLRARLFTARQPV